MLVLTTVRIWLFAFTVADPPARKSCEIEPESPSCNLPMSRRVIESVDSPVRNPLRTACPNAAASRSAMFSKELCSTCPLGSVRVTPSAIVTRTASVAPVTAACRSSLRETIPRCVGSKLATASANLGLISTDLTKSRADSGKASLSCSSTKPACTPASSSSSSIERAVLSLAHCVNPVFSCPRIAVSL